ncbi:AMSH-like ubiquitin thioesterase 3 isoform X2 [Camellia sinensis]|uniref:AMSH-like ubiquitin thioesterase 3 isoform X2 n=1 Tax=Camellia sinensis TaxID=4442 RepID=UPI00103677AD|nr:AMSH-like ubiquitin thioesterase 3 isoform X2 [Camellia sinensis]
MKIQDYILNQEVAQYDLQEVKDGESEVGKSTMESLLSLDDGRQSLPADDSCPPLNNEPVKMMDDFLRLARENTAKNLETCGVLAGSLKNRVFHITTPIVPKQESTLDSCQTLNEEEIFEVQDKYSLFPLGWIHCFFAENRG